MQVFVLFAWIIKLGVLSTVDKYTYAEEIRELCGDSPCTEPLYLVRYGNLYS